jgi:hypothetical protein
MDLKRGIDKSGECCGKTNIAEQLSLFGDNYDKIERFASISANNRRGKSEN